MTTEELFALPDNDRIDRRLIRGRLVERPYPFRSPAHAGVIANLSGLLRNWERSADGTGWVAYGYGCPFRLSTNPDTLVCFDGSVIPASLDARTSLRTQFIDGPPVIAIEVVDLSDPLVAIRELVDAALDFGVSLIWLIDPVEEFVEVHRPGCGSVILHTDDELVGSFVGPLIRFPVSALFE